MATGLRKRPESALIVVYSVILFVVGLLAGFIVNVVATRLAANRPILGSLRCTRSPHSITLAQALPVAGYLGQRGRCSTCGKRLSLSFPLVEAATALLFVGLFLVEGWGLAYFFHALYIVFLMLVLVVDWKHRDIYLTVIAGGSVIALIGSLLMPGATIWDAAIAAGIAGGFFLLAYVLAKLIFPKIEEPLGAGDILLALMMGLMLGFPNIVGALLIGPLIAGAAAILLLVSRRSKWGDFIPYGVALCAAAILFIVYPTPFADALHLPALVHAVSGLLGK
jgi:prepilin signal peptidase PulO-like enzyme (type II secretory pathway)